MTNRVRIGKRVLGGVTKYGLWISVPGVDVLTATADSDFLVSSEISKRLPQVIDRGSFSLANGSSQIIYFPEGLSVVPNVKFQTSDDGGYTLVPFFKSGYANVIFTATVTTSQVTFYNGNGVSVPTRYLVAYYPAA